MTQVVEEKDENGSDHLQREDDDSRGIGDDTEEKDENESDHLYHVDEEETSGTD